MHVATELRCVIHDISRQAGFDNVRPPLPRNLTLQAEPLRCALHTVIDKARDATSTVATCKLYVRTQSVKHGSSRCPDPCCCKYISSGCHAVRTSCSPDKLVACCCFGARDQNLVAGRFGSGLQFEQAAVGTQGAPVAQACSATLRNACTLQARAWTLRKRHGARVAHVLAAFGIPRRCDQQLAS